MTNKLKAYLLNANTGEWVEAEQVHEAQPDGSIMIIKPVGFPILKVKFECPFFPSVYNETISIKPLAE